MGDAVTVSADLLYGQIDGSGVRCGWGLSSRTAQRHNVNIVHWRNAGYAYAFMGTIELPRPEKLADKAWRDLGKT